MKNRPRIPTPDVTKEVVDRENRLAQMNYNNNNSSTPGAVNPTSLANALVAHNPVPYSEQLPVAVQVLLLHSCTENHVRTFQLDRSNEFSRDTRVVILWKGHDLYHRACEK